MTNKELQDLLNTFPDDAVIFKYEDGLHDAYLSYFMSLHYLNLETEECDWPGDDALDYTIDKIDHSKVKTIIL